MNARDVILLCIDTYKENLVLGLDPDDIFSFSLVSEAISVLDSVREKVEQLDI